MTSQTPLAGRVRRTGPVAQLVTLAHCLTPCRKLQRRALLVDLAGSLCALTAELTTGRTVQVNRPGTAGDRIP